MADSPSPRDESAATYDVTVEKLVYGGDGLARLPDGRAVFVPFALPGEQVRIALAEDKPRFAKAVLLEVLEVSAARITPRCVHYGLCGGCHYQHMAYAEQLAAKERVLRDQLERIGGFREIPLQPMVPAPEPWHYRNQVQFHLSEEGQLSYVAVGGEAVLPIEECHLPMDAINALWPQLDLEPLPDLQRVALRQGADEQLMVILESRTDEAYELNIEAAVAAVQLGPESTQILSDDLRIEIEVLGQPFRVTANAFFQVNTAMAGAMVTHLLERLPLQPESVVLDVYCGVGLFSAFLAPRVGQLIGIEQAPLACEDFVANLDAFDNVTLYEAAAEEALPALDVQPDIVVVDPPRAGLEGAALDAIVAMRPAVIAYVSCDPATLARDGKRLVEQGYTLEEITPFDVFPQTYHIESVSVWRLGG